MSWLSNAFGWIKDNKDWIEPVVKGGMALAQSGSRDNLRGDLVNTGKQAVIDDYNRQVNTQKEWLEWMAQKQAIEGRNRAASSAAANARARASAQNQRAMNDWEWREARRKAKAERQEEKNRQEALLKGLEGYRGDVEKSLAPLRPWQETGARLLPQVEKTYSGGLDTMNMLRAYLSSPEQIKAMEAGTPAYEQRIPLPQFLRKK